jgi:DNA replication regulator SLD2
VTKRVHVTKTPSKTPVKDSMNPWEVDPYESPSMVRMLFTPSKKTVLRPTPQKDGLVLGLFDLLPPSQETPSRKDNMEGQGVKGTVHSTPRKSRLHVPDTARHSRTPGSRSKSFMLEGFNTPLKNRTGNSQGSKTPSSVSKLHFSTPSFLRRTQLPMVNENNDGTELSPELVRVPRKPLVRGLSSMLAGLRKMQDDALDDDLEALHEMEAEMDSGPTLPKPAVSKPKVPEAEILVADSQPGFPLGGFDDEGQFDSDGEEEDKNLGRDGQQTRVYKKKGQKRTTRKVKMKPVRSKPPTSTALTTQNLTALNSESEDELSTPISPIPETQPQVEETLEGFADARNFDSDSQSEYTASEGGTRYRRPDQSKKRKGVTKDGKIRSIARKVGVVAHQNFKRLKLRNSGTKGGPGVGSRFRRRK